MAVCHRCGRTIRPRRSKTTGKVSLHSGIRKHYWDYHRTTMMKGVRKRERKANPCWKPKKSKPKRLKNRSPPPKRTYYCRKCRMRHRTNSVIGRRHRR